jgi:hypothetical protein
MESCFTVWVNGELVTVNDYKLIPSDFDFVVEFRPAIPPPPHTEQQHNEIHQWQQRFQLLLEREKQCQQ